MAEFITKTDPPLTGRYFQEKGKHVVTFGRDEEPELIKVLYIGDSFGQATAEYNHVKAHYEEREKKPVVREDELVKDPGAEFKRRDKRLSVSSDEAAMGRALLNSHRRKQ